MLARGHGYHAPPGKLVITVQDRHSCNSRLENAATQWRAEYWWARSLIVVELGGIADWKIHLMRRKRRSPRARRQVRRRRPPASSFWIAPPLRRTASWMSETSWVQTPPLEYAQICFMELVCVTWAHSKSEAGDRMFSDSIRFHRRSTWGRRSRSMARREIVSLSLGVLYALFPRLAWEHKSRRTLSIPSFPNWHLPNNSGRVGDC